MVPHLAVCIYDREMYNTYKTFFANNDHVSIVYGNIFNYKADCFITAGNSFGMMDGGIDGHVNYFFDYIQKNVQCALHQEWAGECPVGASVIVPISKKNDMGCKYLCYAPTMRTPGIVSKTINAYLATRGALVACAKHPRIRNAIIPMVCLGVGRMDPAIILHQIDMAVKTFVTPVPRDWFAINEMTHELVPNETL